MKHFLHGSELRHFQVVKVIQIILRGFLGDGEAILLLQLVDRVLVDLVFLNLRSGGIPALNLATSA